MSKSAGLLVILGLAVGLWLGFNPQAHKQTVQYWDKAKTALAQVKTQTTAKVNVLDSHTTTWLRSSSKTKVVAPAAPAAPSASSTWKQITAFFNTLWTSVQRMWASLTNKLAKIKA